MTDAERRLWTMLRGHRFERFGFRRQVPIGSYIVDFVCHGRCLIIEVDGGQHADRAAQDAVRDQWLASVGYRVLRFWNGEVLRNSEGVALAILQALSVEVPPSPTLPLKGGGSSLERRARVEDA